MDLTFPEQKITPKFTITDRVSYTNEYTGGKASGTVFAVTARCRSIFTRAGEIVSFVPLFDIRYLILPDKPVHMGESYQIVYAEVSEDQLTALVEEI